MKPRLKFLAAAIPYLAVAGGLYLLESAWVAILLYHAGLAVVMTIDRPHDLTRALRSGWHTPAAVTGAVIGAAGGIAVYVLWPYVSLEDVTLSETLSRIGLTGASWWIFGLYFVAVHPVLEEIGWRGHMAAQTKRPHLIDIAFAGYHVLVLVLFLEPLWTGVAFAVLVLASWVWRSVVGWKGGLGVVLVSHAVADLSIFVAATLIAGG